MKMKIAAVTLYPWKKAGSASYSYKLYQEISRHCEVIIFSDQDSNAKDNGVIVVRAWHRNSLWTPFQICKKVLKERPHICHIQLEYRTFNDYTAMTAIQTMLLLILMSPSSTKKYITLHGVISAITMENLFSERTSTAIFRGLLKLFYKSLELLVKKIIVHTHVMMAVLQKEYNVKSGKIIVIPHGVDRASHSNKKIEKEETTLLFHGYIRPSKGLEYLLDALHKVIKSYPKTELIIAGGAPYQEKNAESYFIKKLEAKIEFLDLKRNVKIFRGFLSEEELDRLISESDIVIFPYIDFFVEASGALARTMDYAKPVICTKTPRFIGDLEDLKDCLMVPPCNGEKLANAIIKLIQDKNLREKLKVGLKEKAVTRYWDAIAEKHIQLFGGTL
jgi:glycosyltransferase involved in cell wall biosynthesis